MDPPADAPRPLHEPVSSTLEELGYAVEVLIEPSGDARVIADRAQVTVKGPRPARLVGAGTGARDRW